jgi:anti-sigma factor RsiW
MVDIIRLNDDLHAQAQLLLPWYVTGTLSDEESAQVEQHLSECPECREDVKMEKALARQVRSMTGDAESGWAVLEARIHGVETGRRRKVVLLSRRIPVGWALAAQAASLAILIPVLTFALARPHALYRTLGAAPSVAPGNLVVIFKPEASEATLRTILTQNQARIVDGPTSAAAYVLRVTANQRAATLARLKSDRNISFAEPIDGDNR